MNIGGVLYRTILLAKDGWSVKIIDQTRLPHELAVLGPRNLSDAAAAIHEMRVRGAPLIGATAAYGLCLALKQDASDPALEGACRRLRQTRPTAVNLAWALDQVMDEVRPLPTGDRAESAYKKAAEICDEDIAICKAIGENGLSVIGAVLAENDSGPVNILTHCNAGWLATVDWGTALAPVYAAHDAGIAVHVWVDETRPRNQGAGLTAWGCRATSPRRGARSRGGSRAPVRRRDAV